MGFNLQTLIGLLGTIAGLGVAAKIFWSVAMYERGARFRLGKPVYKKTKTGKVLRVLFPGRPGVTIPFVWKLIKIFVGIRVKETDDIEVMRFDPEHGERQAWIMKGELNFRVQSSRPRLLRAMTRAEDINQVVLSHAQAAIRQALYDNPVGTLETSEEIHQAAKALCKSDLNGVGVSLTKVNVAKLRQADATIMANALKKSAGVNIETLTAMMQRFK